MTEYTVGMNVGGREMDVPTLVPTLSRSELEYLRTANLEDPRMFETPQGQSIIDKAYRHAEGRVASGQSVFADRREHPVVRGMRRALLGGR